MRQCCVCRVDLSSPYSYSTLPYYYCSTHCTRPHINTYSTLLLLFYSLFYSLYQVSHHHLLHLTITFLLTLLGLTSTHTPPYYYCPIHCTRSHTTTYSTLLLLSYSLYQVLHHLLLYPTITALRTVLGLTSPLVLGLPLPCTYSCTVPELEVRIFIYYASFVSKNWTRLFYNVMLFLLLYIP